MKPTVHINHPDEVAPLWVLGDEVRFTGSVDGRDLHTAEVRIPPGSGTPPHRHRSIEIFRVTAGEVTFGLFGDGPPRTVVARPGTIVTVPADVPHHYQNRGPGPAAMTVVLERQMIDFFREVGAATPPPPGPPPPEALARVLAACARHGIELLAP